MTLPFGQFVSVEEALPDHETEVEVIRDYGSTVCNPGHHACGCRFGIERTKVSKVFCGFLCDAVSSGRVIYWRYADSMSYSNVGYEALTRAIEE